MKLFITSKTRKKEQQRNEKNQRYNTVKQILMSSPKVFYLAMDLRPERR